jgi:hypothetical protein
MDGEDSDDLDSMFTNRLAVSCSDQDQRLSDMVGHVLASTECFLVHCLETCSTSCYENNSDTNEDRAQKYNVEMDKSDELIVECMKMSLMKPNVMKLIMTKASNMQRDVNMTAYSIESLEEMLTTTSCISDSQLTEPTLMERTEARIFNMLQFGTDTDSENKTGQQQLCPNASAPPSTKTSDKSDKTIASSSSQQLVTCSQRQAASNGLDIDAEWAAWRPSNIVEKVLHHAIIRTEATLKN